MRKFIFTLMFAIAGSVWTITEAAVQLPSLCDEWHYVTYYAAGMDIPATPVYYSQHLAADTVIGEHKYRQLRGRVGYRYSSNDDYLGALREGDNADIYYVPTDSTHEYLLYAFNANVGDTLKNLWMGTDMQCTTAIITEISTGRLRTFQAKAHVIVSGHYFEDFWELWTDSVGSATSEGPAGVSVYMLNTPYLACACKDGRKIYVGDANCACDPLRLKSLCDEWHILVSGAVWNGEEYNTVIQRLTTDTLINARRYVRLQQGDTYLGALREDVDSKIYYIPADSVREYLLYAFNAEIGDNLSNVWIGGKVAGHPHGSDVTVYDIKETTPRIFVLSTGSSQMEESLENNPFFYEWIEGVGFAEGPCYNSQKPVVPEFITPQILCAYKGGEQVYASELSQEFGCKFDGALPVTQATKWYGVLYEAYPYRPGFTEPRLSEANYSLQGDTIISGKRYSKLCAENGNYVGAIRYSASGRQAYYVPMYNEDYLSQIEELEIEKDAEYLLYDLNVNVGDVVKAFNSTVNLPCGREPLSDWTVLDVQTIDGRIHARVKGGPYDTETEWIEGVGTPYIIWSGLRDCQPTDGSTVRPYTLCAADNAGNILYSYNLEHIGVINECPNWSRITPDNPLRLKSLCDTWNIHGVAFPDGHDHHLMFTQQLTTDTLIAGQRYVRLEQGSAYLGALRETDNARIYFIPAGSTHEYLLYAFHANQGDTFDNVWFGGRPSYFPNGSHVTIREITEQNGRKVFELDASYTTPYEEIVEWPYSIWIEGVGLQDGPAGSDCPLDCAGDYGQSVLCAYKDGVHVYASAFAEEHGCWYTTDDQIDTIPLYVNDGPGSTTVTPVDPNQVVATLNDNLLTIREQSGEEVTYSLAVTPISHAPARHELPEAQKEVSAGNFRNSVAVQLSEDGSYTLTLSKAGWENDIYGSFDYITSGLQPATATDAPARKLLRNGQLLIQQGDKIFTLTGVQVE